jgi:hypothetical protein
MDRGRVGTLAIGNKTIRDQMIAHQQEVHLERIHKIKTRKPGSSNTMDNTPPVIIPAALINPRKIAKKKEFNMMTEKENRVLLKRISRTLTAPPKITDAEYQAMRKLIGNMKGGKQAYEEAVFARHHKRYLDHLKTMGPYYDPNEWELDYRRQKVQQMFMRQVPYERPSNYKVKELPAMKTLGTIHDKNDFKPHHTQMKTYKRNAKMDSGARKSGQVNRVKAQRDRMHNKNSIYTQPEVEAKNEFDADAEEERTELACTHRFVNVSVLDAETQEETTGERWGEISCYLLDSEMLLICAELQEQEEGKESQPAYEAEAEIDIVAIASLRKMDGTKSLNSFLQGNTDPLQGLARFISESVDLKVEDGVARIILNMMEEEDDAEYSPDTREEAAFFITEGEDESSTVKPVQDLFNDLNLQQDSLGSDEVDAYRCSISDVCCPVKLVGGKKSQGRPPKPDSVMLSTDVFCEADVVNIEVTVTQESATEFKNGPAIKVGEVFTATVALPTIMQADGELMREYFGNLVENLQIDTHVMTGKNNMQMLA